MLKRVQGKLVGLEPSFYWIVIKQLHQSIKF